MVGRERWEGCGVGERGRWAGGIWTERGEGGHERKRAGRGGEGGGIGPKGRKQRRRGIGERARVGLTKGGEDWEREAKERDSLAGK